MLFGDQKRQRLVCGKILEKDDPARIIQKLYHFLSIQHTLCCSKGLPGVLTLEFKEPITIGQVGVRVCFLPYYDFYGISILSLPMFYRGSIL